MFFIRGSMKKLKVNSSKIVKNKKLFTVWYLHPCKGRTLLELITALSISVLITMMLVNIYVRSIKNYNETQQYDSEVTSIYEALMYIDHYINDSLDYHVGNQKIFVTDKYGKVGNYIFLNAGNIRVAYKNGSGALPLLYDVSEFNLNQNGKVIFIEIVTKKGNVGKKAVGRI